MIDRIMPIFAVIGFLSSILYIMLACWIVYKKIAKPSKSNSRNGRR